MGIPRGLAPLAFLVIFSALAVGVAAAQPYGGDGQSAPRITQITSIASATTGVIAGQVLDERGQPLPDVVISAIGGSTSFAVSDGAGQFTLRALTPGPYLVRAHLEGYVAARNTIVTVRPSTRSLSTFTLRREGDGRVVAAGASAIALAPDAVSTRDDGETAWRLRRLKRSILKDADTLTLPTDDDWFLTDSLQIIGRAFESSARMAGALFSHSPLQGQVNLLTTGTFDTPGELLSTDRTRGVAFFSVGAPVGDHGDWTVKAALNQGDLSSWIVAGDYVTRTPARHRYQFGMSYGLHRYLGGNAVALAAMPEAARNVGAVYAHDEWKVSEFFSVGYGGHYAHYDYLLQRAHFSPRLTATIRPSERTRIRGVATRRVNAPGAEEFLPPTNNQILPPQRTFAPLTRAGFLPEDTRHYEVAVERVLDGVTIGVRAFQQGIDDQLVTLFGLRSENSQPAEIGHYFVGSAGNVDVRGWGLAVTHSLSSHVRGSFDYSVADAEWADGRSLDRARLSRTMPAALRDSSERIHDLTTAVETAFPQSATRVFVLYKMNSAYIRDTELESRPGFDSRWDVQVIQALPFMNFTSADWEMLVGVRNLFRESFTETSVYDELLVARPPKRLVGGITVKF
ncbi:MAG TPA: TonB-dependent receptor [Vicinamibacterales bacterium]|nr:TonB-dependent receptor [Vicinamibacterales bacterium]